MPNKCVALNGQILPGTTEVAILNNNSRNLKVSKILVTEGGSKLTWFKLGFKEESTGLRVFEELSKAVRSE